MESVRTEQCVNKLHSQDQGKSASTDRNNIGYFYFYPLNKCYVYGEVVMQFVEIKATARVCKSCYDWF